MIKCNPNENLGEKSNGLTSKNLKIGASCNVRPSFSRCRNRNRNDSNISYITHNNSYINIYIVSPKSGSQTER